MALFLKTRNASPSQCERVFFTILEAFNLKILENRGCLCGFSVTVDFFVRLLFLCLTVSTVFMESVVLLRRDVVTSAFQSRSAVVSSAEFQRLPCVPLAIF